MKKRKTKRAIVVERKHSREAEYGEWRGVTYQRELVLCGKAKCRKRHGPYWYAYWTKGKRTHKRYIGKEWRTLRDAERGLGNTPASEREVT